MKQPNADRDNEMDAVFQALGNASRRRMLDIVKAQPGCSVGEVARQFEISRIAVMKHLGALEGAGLLLSLKQGRTRRLHVNAAPLQLIHDRWTTEWSGLWAAQLTDLKHRVESGAAVDRHPEQKAPKRKATA